MARRGRRVIRKYTPTGKCIARFGPQYKLASMLGISQQTVSKKLRGECAISLKDLQVLSNRLNVPLGAFFDPDDLCREWVCECGARQWVAYDTVLKVGEPSCKVCNEQMELVE
jgi:transcriptional regulator with XRE-family HTH domain